MIAAGATRLAPVPRAALGFVWGVASLSVLAFLFYGFFPMMLPALLVLTLSLFLSRHVRSYSSTQVKNLVAQVQPKEKNETIELLLNDIRDQSSDWLWETDEHGSIYRASDRFCQASGRERAELEGRHLCDLLLNGSDELAELVERKAVFREVPVSITGPGGTRHWTLTGRPVLDPGKQFLGYRGVATDVTEKVVAVERLSYLAHHDTLKD